mmetsp:Transcript_34695/g.82942  ORF Transcript_34695/g.82942 Transcript_34695/m.82942 type:complete len:374 (+) Transcript_34695:1807-2928(+)
MASCNSFNIGPTSGSDIYFIMLAGLPMDSWTAFITFGFCWALAMTACTFGLDMAFCAASIGFPPMPPNGLPPPAAPPKGLPPPMPPIPFSISSIDPPPIPPNGLPPAAPPNGLPPAAPPNGLPPPPPNGLLGPAFASLVFFVLGPTLSLVMTSTFAAVTSSTSSSTARRFFFLDFLTPSTRASAKVRTNSDFSKKVFVETPSPSSSALSSPTFMALHASISASRRACLSAEFIGAGEGAVAVGDVAAVLLEDAVAVVATGVFPSFRACTKAFTSSLFSRKDLVDIPYDSNSDFNSPIRIDFTSSSSAELLNNLVGLLDLLTHEGIVRLMMANGGTKAPISSTASSMAAREAKREIRMVFLQRFPIGQSEKRLV